MAPKKTTTKKADVKEPADEEDLNLRFRNAVATLNNYTDDMCKKVQDFYSNYCDYGVYGKEVGESGTPHLQMYFELKDRKSLRQLKKLIPGNPHLEPGRAPDPKARAGYCKKGEDDKKDDDIEDSNYYSKYFEVPGPGYKGFEHGKENISSPGKRTDIVKAHNSIKSGEMSVRELRQENPMLYHQYGRVLNALEEDFLATQFRCGEMTKGIWYHGEEGRGKSHALFMTEMEEIGGFDPAKVYDWNLEEEFQTYAGEEIILINEYKGVHQIKYGVWLKLVDKWPYKIKRKGLNPFPMLAKKVIVASIFHPTEVEWNLSTKDNLNQLLDRFEIKKLDGPNRRKIV